MDSEGKPANGGANIILKGTATGGTGTAWTADYVTRVNNYFNINNSKITSASAIITGYACEAVLIKDSGGYVGSYPKAAPAKDTAGKANGDASFAWTLTDAKSC